MDTPDRVRAGRENARPERIALAARDACRAVTVLATLADGPASNAELRWAAGFYERQGR